MAKKIYVVAAITVRKDGKILCARRGDGKNPSTARKWEFPGGKVERGELPENALARELREELDFPVVVGKKFMTVRHAYPECEIEMEAFFCVPENTDAEFVLREHTEARWLAPKDLPQLDWAGADIAIVRALAEKAK